MTKPHENKDNIIENNLINIQEINNNNMVDTPVDIPGKISNSEYWSGTLPSKIDSGYNSESIQIFKINQKENQNEVRNIINQESHASKRRPNIPIGPNREPTDSIKAVKNSKYNQVLNIHKDISISIFSPDNRLKAANSNQNIFYANQMNKTTNLNNSSIYLDERISKIDRKMGKLQDNEPKDISFHDNKILNFDSRILSMNDMSGIDDSMTPKRKSFLSYNN